MTAIGSQDNYHPKLARSGYKEQLDTHVEEQPVGPIQGVKLM